VLNALLGDLGAVDGRLSEEVTDLRWPPLTDAMVLLSSWWIKGPLFVLVALAVDLLARRRSRVVPWAAGLTLASVLLGRWPPRWSSRPSRGRDRRRATRASPPSDPCRTRGAYRRPRDDGLSRPTVALAVLSPRLRLPALASGSGRALSRSTTGALRADVLAARSLGAGIAGPRSRPLRASGAGRAERRTRVAPPARRRAGSDPRAGGGGAGARASRRADVLRARVEVQRRGVMQYAHPAGVARGRTWEDVARRPAAAGADGPTSDHAERRVVAQLDRRRRFRRSREGRASPEP
jgi:hypothetical protein